MKYLIQGILAIASSVYVLTYINSDNQKCKERYLKAKNCDSKI